VHAKARYADDLSEREANRRVARGRNAAIPVESTSNRRGIEIFARPGAPVVAVQDGRIVKMGRSKRLGRYVMLRDAYGNTYTYARLGSVARKHPVAKKGRTSKDAVARELKLPKADPKPKAPASAGVQRKGAPTSSARPSRDVARAPERLPQVRKERLFASPRRPAAFAAGGREQVGATATPERAANVSTFSPYFAGDFGLDAKDAVLKDMKVGSKVIAARSSAASARRRPAWARTRCSRSARRPRRPAHRPEADPRRLEAPRVDRDLPRAGQEPVLRAGRPRRPRSARSCS
jgi:hypothetical protein